MSKYARVPDNVSNILKVIDAGIKYEHANKPPRGFLKYHPSAFGSCLRKMQYSKYSEMGIIDVPEEQFAPKQIRIFDNGHSMHDRWVEYAEKCGILRGRWICSNSFCSKFDKNGNFDNSRELDRSRMYGGDDLLGVFKPEKCVCGCNKFIYQEISVDSEELNMHGHADMIWDFSNFDVSKYEEFIPINVSELPKKPIVVDMKSIKNQKFSQLSNFGPSLEYQIQLTIYANLLPVEYGLLVYENKDNQETAVFQIDKNTETIFNQIKKQAIQMQKISDKKLLPPPRPGSKDSYECSYCPFKKLCHKSSVWKDPDLDQKRKSFYGNLLK